MRHVKLVLFVVVLINVIIGFLLLNKLNRSPSTPEKQQLSIREQGAADYWDEATAERDKALDTMSTWMKRQPKEIAKLAEQCELEYDPYRLTISTTFPSPSLQGFKFVTRGVKHIDKPSEDDENNKGQFCSYHIWLSIDINTSLVPPDIKSIHELRILGGGSLSDNMDNQYPGWLLPWEVSSFDTKARLYNFGDNYSDIVILTKEVKVTIYAAIKKLVNEKKVINMNYIPDVVLGQ